ncbi:albusnodin/ikarugamycin family macrolactam cyclase [Streptomyces sp. NPDC056347]|uniref:albusnodin/ikarugamycin family macrolactam cyclase n=1 Tax=Streptomyces sp. NPDC056347 TaxID=3345790 RepID=UPI0035DD26D5
MREHNARWYGGCAPGSPPAATPVGARLLWRDPALWVCGDWNPAHVRTLELGNARIAVLGPCSASEHELARALAAPDLPLAAGSWAGSYTVVRTVDGGFVEVLADAASASPLYLVDTPCGVVWASSARALSPLTGARVDVEWLGSYLRDKFTPAPGRSAWAGVKPVPPGHLLSLAPRRTGLSPWWKPVRRAPEEVSRTLRHALAEGVRVRVEGTSATTDLAGMDSTTVALLAAQYGPVTGMTLHPEGATRGGDVEYARALNIPGLERKFFPLGVRHLPFAPSDVPLPATDEPATSTATWAMFSEQLRVIAATGSGCHLTGDGGDALFLSSPTHLASLVRQGHWLRMLGDAMEWARLRRQNPRPLIAAALRGNAGHIGRTARPRPPWLAVSAPDLNPSVGMTARTVFAASLRNAARPANSEIQLADTLGVALANPYFDAAVVDAVISSPAEQRYSARRYKPLLADSFADLLPDAHRKRASKGMFASDFHHGLRLNLRRVLALADGRLAAEGIITPGPLQAAIHAAALGAQTVWPPLLAVLSAEAWLEAVERSPGTEWKHAETTPAGAL